MDKYVEIQQLNQLVHDDFHKYAQKNGLPKLVVDSFQVTFTTHLTLIQRSM